ncbi:hypothetical protein GCM10020227_49260 [Streptomyces flavovirens]
MRVCSVSVLIRVREASEEHGSLKPMCPSVPMPSSWRSTPPRVRERLVVRLARGLDVLGGAVGAHEGGLGQPERLDDLAQHDRAVGLGVARGQPDVLVELADAGPGGVHGTGADLRRQCPVDGQRGRAGGNAEQGVGLAAQQGRDGLRDEFPACRGVRDDDNFHAVPADLMSGVMWYRPIMRPI